jgi:hypothetical protein
MTAEDRLREVLDDLAPRPPADEAALAGVRRAVGRRRRRQVAARVAAAVAVVGLGAGAVLATAGRDGPTVQTPATQPPETTEQGPATSAPGVRVEIGNISFEAPPGWTAIQAPSVSLESSVRAICVAPGDGAAPAFEGCSGVLIYSGDPLPGYQGAPYEQDGLWQFAHSTEPIPCPFDDPPGSVIEPGMAGLQPIDGGGRAVGDHTASYNRWFARCGDAGATFTPEAWLLPTSKILILDVFGHPETEALLASVDFR